jgi:hypothetical protein
MGAVLTRLRRLERVRGERCRACGFPDNAVRLVIVEVVVAAGDPPPPGEDDPLGPCEECGNRPRVAEWREDAP